MHVRRLFEHWGRVVVATSTLLCAACPFAATDGPLCEDACHLQPCVDEEPVAEIATFEPFSVDDTDALTRAIVQAVLRPEGVRSCVDPIACPSPGASSAATSCLLADRGPVWTISITCTDATITLAIRAFAGAETPRDLTVHIVHDDLGRVLSLSAEQDDGSWARHFAFTYRWQTGLTLAALHREQRLSEDRASTTVVFVVFDGDERAERATSTDADGTRVRESAIVYDGSRPILHSIDLDGDTVVDERHQFLYEGDLITEVRHFRTGADTMTLPVGGCCSEECGGVHVALERPVDAR